jgi:butyrate kinase
MEEVGRLSLDEFDTYMEVAELREYDHERAIHEQAWANQTVQATTANGKRSKYRKFKDFYDDEKQIRKVQLRHSHGRIVDSKQAEEVDIRRKAEIVNRRLQEYYKRKGGVDG